MVQLHGKLHVQKKLTSKYTLINVPPPHSIFDIIFPVFVFQTAAHSIQTPIPICFLANGDGCIIIEVL